MPQKSYGYAAGRVGVLSLSLLSEAALEQLTQAGSVEEAARLLTDAGWGEASTRQDIERLCDRHVLDACKTVKELSPEQQTTDCFLIQYDILNLKTLIKSRMLGRPDADLSPAGTLDAEKLRRAVAENSYQDLPPRLKDAMERIEKRMAMAPDPLFVDAELDKAMFAFVQDRLPLVKSPEVRGYFEAKAELTNLMIALRCARLGKNGAFARDLLVAGGRIPLDAFVHIAEEAESAPSQVAARPYAAQVLPVLRGEPVNLPMLEKATDDYLLSLLRPGKYRNDSVLPLIGYLVARQREAGAVRLIITAKAARVPAEEIAGRMRRLY